MENLRIVSELQELQNRIPTTAENCYRVLEKIGGIKYNYYVYLSEPIDCDKELLRLPDADYEMCCVLLTMLLREDHFSNGSFGERVQSGVVDRIISRMITLLCEQARAE